MQQCVKCRNPAIKMIIVRRARQPDHTALTCLDHHAEVWHSMLALSREIRGSLHTTRIVVPRRKAVTDVHIHTHIDESLHARMVLTSQGRRMSMRAYVSRAINNQITMDELEARKNDRHAMARDDGGNG